jgi:fused signal recognition particle receptor
VNFAGKIKEFFGRRHSVSDDFFDALGDLLIEGDFGAAPAMMLVENLESLARKERITEPALLKQRFEELLTEGLLDASPDKQLEALPEAKPPAVILLLGVNGVGKTPTAAKLACRYKSRGKRPILAAADTFRAGAINQLKIHGEKLNVRVVAHQQGGDPAAVVYDAVEAALSGGGDLVIADTAGRMHTKSALVEELKKTDRVVENKLGRASLYIKWLVLDATTGRNALSQAEVFHQAAALDGAILTKYDSGAKGGIVFSLASELKIPTVFLCNGEGYDHIMPFEKSAFAKDFAG